MYWVCRWTNGLVSARSPPSHILAGEKVCIQAIRPMQLRDGTGLRAKIPDGIRGGEDRLGDDLNRYLPDCSEMADAISFECVKTWRSVESP